MPRARLLVVPLLAVAIAVGATLTAIAAGPSTTYAFLARGDNPIDALAAAPIAGRLDAPVLLTPPTTLSDAARTGLVAADPDVVVVAGGAAAVSDDVMAEVAGLLPDADVRRVAGDTRYVTAEALAALIREYDAAFSYTDTNAFGISCGPAQVLTGISSAGAAVCATDDVDGGDAATLAGTVPADLRESGREAYCTRLAEAPRTWSSTPCTVSTTAIAGSDGSPAVTLGVDGIPVIAHTALGFDLAVTRCLDPLCGTATTQVLATANQDGTDPAITIGADGLPIIAHGDDDAEDLRVTHCADIDCANSTSTTFSLPGAEGRFNAIAIGADGLAIIAHREINADDLLLTHCDDVACTTATHTTVDAGGNVGTLPSIGFAGDGFPIISYTDWAGASDLDNTNLRIARCHDTTCSGPTITEVATPEPDGRFSSLAIGVDGLPVIAHYRGTAETFDPSATPNSQRNARVTHCADEACTSSTTTDVAVGPNDSGAGISIMIDRDGLPLLVIRDATTFERDFVRCDDLACSSHEVGTIGTTGVTRASAVLGLDGFPLVAYDAFNLSIARLPATGVGTGSGMPAPPAASPSAPATPAGTRLDED